jgi:RHS repeat-associated protein
VVAESDLAGTLKSEYVFFDGERVARKDFPGNTVAYYFSDHLNTASVITNASGTITSESDYYPWGGELQFLNNDSNDYKFTGKKRDTETGLDYFGARYYSNGLSRFLTPDWSAGPTPVPYADIFDPQSLNLYAYVGGNPTTRIDGVGHQQSQVPIGINVGIYWKNGVDAGIETHNNPRQAGRDALQSVGAFIQSIFNLLPYGDNKPHPHYQAPVGIQAPNSAVGRATTTVLVIASLFVPAPKAAPIVDLTNTVRAPSVIAKAQEALDLAVSTRSGNPGAMAAGFDTTTGNVAIGTSRNVPQIGEINPQLGQAAESVGGVGAVNPGAAAPVGCCAEFDAANQLLNSGSSLQDIQFIVVRPRTGEPIPMCPNCATMFPSPAPAPPPPPPPPPTSPTTGPNP